MAELDARAGTPVTSETDAVRQDSTTTWRGIVAGVAVVLVLGALTRFFETQVPRWADGTPVQQVAKSIEYPVYAIALGLAGAAILTKLGLRERLSAGFRTEFFIKTGVVLLGASINLKILVTAAGPAIVQALLLITVVFGFTWWFGGAPPVAAAQSATDSASVSSGDSPTVSGQPGYSGGVPP